MSRSVRRSKAEARLAQLETEFVQRLTAALREYAAGRWGLFGQNNDLLSVKSPAVDLIALGEDIGGVRAELGLRESFMPFERFVLYREMRGPNTPGEPKAGSGSA
jgi:hypothetical protein